MPPKKKSPFEIGEDAPNLDFMELITRVSIDNFMRMVSSSGLTPREVRELCEAFREIKK